MLLLKHSLDCGRESSRSGCILLAEYHGNDGCFQDDYKYCLTEICGCHAD